MKRHLIISILLLHLICLAYLVASGQSGTPNLITARKAIDAEDWDTAITYFTKSISADEAKGNVILGSLVYAHRCQAYFNKDKFDLAIADCDKAIEIKSDTAYVYHLRASSFRRVGKIDRAIADLTHAIQLEPKEGSHYFSRAIAYSDTGNRDQAIQDFGKAIELDPDDEDAYLLRAMAFKQKGDFDQALLDYQAHVKLSPGSVHGHIGLGISYRHKGDFERALISLNRAFELDPRSTDALMFRGIVYADQGMYDLVIRDHSEALRLDPQFVSSYALRGDAYVKKGNYRNAIADFTKSLEIEARISTLYARAWANLYANNGAAAFEDAQKYLVQNGMKGSGPYAVVIGYLGLRKASKPVEAKAFLANAAKQMDQAGWPANLIKYFEGSISEAQLMQLADDNDKLTEAHAYIGVMNNLVSENAAGFSHLEWVRTNGNKKFSEYDLALAELARVPRKTQ